MELRMSLKEMMVVGDSIDYSSYTSKNEDKCHEIESRYHLRRTRNLLQFIVGLLVIVIVTALIDVIAGICCATVILLIPGIIVAIISMIVLIWGYIKMISAFKAELKKTNEAEKAELDNL